MLPGPAARAALERQAVSERDQDTRIRALKRTAPGLAGELATAAFELDRPWLAVARRLDALDRSERAEVLRILTPELGEDLATWWGWSTGEPYQRGWMHRGYRSRDPDHSLAARWEELAWLLRHALHHPRPLVWQAAWAMHLDGVAPLSGLLASAVAHGDQEVTGILRASLRGEHETSGPTRHGFVALLASGDPADWAEVRHLLVTAQRAEGLRQTILEVADLARPDAFATLLDAVCEHGLARFAATVRALGVWVGEELEVRQEAGVATAVATIRDHLRRPPSGEQLAAADPATAYLGLWTLALGEVEDAVAAAGLLLDSDRDGLRLAAARLLADLRIPAASPGLVRALDDPSPPVLAVALGAFAWTSDSEPEGGLDLSLPDRGRSVLRARLGTLGENAWVGTGLVGSAEGVLGDAVAADLLVGQVDGAGAEDFLDPAVLSHASPSGRLLAAERCAEHPARLRGALFAMAADRSSSVRDVVLTALRTLESVTEDEAIVLEQMLRRKAADVRATALQLLLRQEPAAVTASVERLASGNPEQRRAAEELAGTKAAVPRPARQVPAVLRSRPAERTAAVRPVAPAPASWTPYHAGCRLAWTSLNAWLAEHADVEVRTDVGVELLGNLGWGFLPWEGGLPLPEVIGPWWERIEPQLTDGGLELALLALAPRSGREWTRDLARAVVGPVAPQLREVPGYAVPWQLVEALARHAARASWHGPVLGLLEAAAVALPVEALLGPNPVMKRRGRRPVLDRWGMSTASDPRRRILGLVQEVHSEVDLDEVSTEHLDRLWRALRYVDEPEGTLDRWDGPSVQVGTERHQGLDVARMVPDQPDRWPPPVRVVVAALERGLATRADLVDALVLPPDGDRWVVDAPSSDALHHLTTARPEAWARSALAQEVVAEVRAAVVEAECARGDLPSVLSATAREVRSTHGATELVPCLAALGRAPFTRAHTWDPTRESNLSHLVRVNQPVTEDSAERLGRLLAEAGVGERRVLETAVYAPQWARLVEQHLGWPGLESAVWWVHAHTKDDSWSVDPEVRAQWESEVSQRTPLSGPELLGGTADVAWLHDIGRSLGEERLDQVLGAARYASSAGGHQRARLFAEASLGRLSEADLRERISSKRHQDSVRALGLLPLPDRDALLRRYELLRGFVASDRTAGAQRRASETAAVEVAMVNLARTAGYPDPQRLTWAMESEAVRDLAAGPVVARVGDLVVELSLDADGSPRLDVRRGEKTLRSVPAASAKEPQVAALKERAAALRVQVRRVRASLEAACVRGDALEPAELAELGDHPAVGPMLRDLVLVDGQGRVGFPTGGSDLVDAAGEVFAGQGLLRVAHPVDLLASGQWPELQHAVMVGSRRQPFKQLFRELYTLTEGERAEPGTVSRRYAGHQVEGRRARGIFGSRGWVADVETGFSRTFHRERVTAWCELLGGAFTPAEVEDAAIEEVSFRRPGEWTPIPLAEVPPRVFSETMRDLDLVVSVAHSGGVDPEPSQSAVQVRARLVQETAELLGLTNVEVAGHHVRVRGTLGTYSVHLGSAVVHRLPGHAVCLVPVSAQHRGRVFLPFADDDPRTAEVVAKVVLLARDGSIKDPTVLQQLVG